MKIKSALVTQASGSIGGLTASRNRGGLYLRARAMPTNPGTPQQEAVKAIVAQLSNRWVNELDTAGREAWNLYALNVPLPDTLGELRNVGGLAMYVRSNVPRLQTSLPRVDVAPTIFDTGDFSPFGAPGADASADTFTVSFETTDDWVGEDDAGALILSSRPQNVSINYFKNPYRFAAVILGASIGPPTSPFTGPLAFPVGAAGQKVFFQVRVSRADGRLSFPQRLSAIAVA
jgi:hypothetical protein